MKEHNDFILELPNFVPETLCKTIIEKFENSSLTPLRGVVQYNGRKMIIPELKNSMELCTCCEPTMKSENEEIIKYIKDAYKQYMIRLYSENIHNQPFHMFESYLDSTPLHNYIPTIQRQPRGGNYAWHYDNSGSPNHFATLMIYLNTLEHEEGGCTEFYGGRKVRPECGKVLIWPATWAYPHCGNEVKAEYKYAIVVPLQMSL
jgi:hypothetical protein